MDHWSCARWFALCGTVYCVTRKPRHYHFSDDDRLRLHRYFGTRVGEIYVKINLKRCMNTTISGSLYSTRSPLLPFYRSANKNDVSPETLQISMLSQRWRNNSLSFSRAKKKLLCCILYISTDYLLSNKEKLLLGVEFKNGRKFAKITFILILFLPDYAIIFYVQFKLFYLSFHRFCIALITSYTLYCDIYKEMNTNEQQSFKKYKRNS